MRDLTNETGLKVCSPFSRENCLKLYELMPSGILADGAGGQKTYLQETMAFGVQGSLALKHVLILLWVYVLIWEEHRQAFQAKLHCRFCAPKGPKGIHIPKDLKRFVDLNHPDI